jgi:hypothetical protein
MGIDLPPIVNTLRIIQQHCREPLYSSLDIRSVDILEPEFETCLKAFGPTHAVCFSALSDEECAFLETVRNTSSVICIAVAERRGKNTRPGFTEFGFQQTHRLAVQNAGCRKLRYVLIARRIA